MSGKSWFWKYFPWPLVSSFTPHHLTIFVLHRFSSADREVRGTDPAALASALEYVRREKIPVWDLTEVIRIASAGERLPSRGVVFTVDDGYADFHEVGMPVFASFDCPVTLFVPTGFIDRQYWFWWDRLEYAILRTSRPVVQCNLGHGSIRLDCATPVGRATSVRSLAQFAALLHGAGRDVFKTIEDALEVAIPSSPPPRYAPASWEALRRDAKRGLTCGPHTINHPILWPLPAEVMVAEIEGSIATLRDRMPAGHTDVFAYPQGCLSARELDVLSSVGCPAAVLSTGGSVDLPRHLRTGRFARYLIPRQGFEDPGYRHKQAILGIETVKQRVRGWIGHPEQPWLGRTPDGLPPA